MIPLRQSLNKEFAFVLPSFMLAKEGVTNPPVGGDAGVSRNATH
jgi:hypothetical protein